MKTRKLLIAMVCLGLLISGGAAAEFVVPVREIELPPEIAELRARQEELAVGDVTIYASDWRYLSGTGIYGLPDNLKGTVIHGIEDLPPLVERLYEYYGQLGEETLEIGPVYPEDIMGHKLFTLVEYIAGGETGQEVRVEVDKSTGELLGIKGWYYHDRNIEREPRISKEEAIKNLVDTLRRESVYEDRYDPIPTYEGNHKARVIFGPWSDGYAEFWVPMWLVELDTKDLKTDEPVVHLVSPYGRSNHARSFLKK